MTTNKRQRRGASRVVYDPKTGEARATDFGDAIRWANAKEKETGKPYETISEPTSPPSFIIRPKVDKPYVAPVAEAVEVWSYDRKARRVLDENGLPVAKDVNPEDGATIVRALLALRDQPEPPAVDPLSIARDAMTAALLALDTGDCDSGGDYHSSTIGRHVDAEGGRLTCPACKLRKALDLLDKANAPNVEPKAEPIDEEGDHDDTFRDAAFRKWNSSNVNIDMGATVSDNGQTGAWVAAWVWVTDEAAGVKRDNEE
jgi:hypothetical protein